MSTKDQVDKCMKIHDTLAEFWNWAYYDTPHRDCSWLLSEYVKRLKPDVEKRVPVMLQEIKKLLDQHDEDKFSILDVGCGVGGFIDRIMKTLVDEYPRIQFRTTGIDISCEMIDYAVKNLRSYDVELLCGNIADPTLKFKNEPFDVAVLMVTLSFYNDEGAEEILFAIRDRLEKAGNLVIMDFAWSYRWKKLKLFAKPMQRLTDTFFSHLIGESYHFTNRTEDQLITLLNDTGFEVSQSYLSEKMSTMKGMRIIVASKVKSPEKSIDVALQVPTTVAPNVDY